MPIGAYYYPEHWSPNQWQRDLKKMAELGFEFTHFAEFAWANIEPVEGKFNFEWLDESIRLADESGLKVILCTPTPTPPVWLTQKHPEILLVNESGITQQHGSRLHINYMHKTYQYYVQRVVEEMGKRYGNDKRVWGWQLDNEPHLGTLYDYSEGSLDDFHTWLQIKYQTIDDLNRAWGTAFWSQTFNNFEQILLPNNKTAPQGANPHALLDFQRFTADQVAAFLRFQTQILNKHISNEQWITTNFAYYKFLPSVDLFRSRDDLDFASHTMYLLSTFLNYPQGEFAHRLGSGLELSFSNEMAKSIEGFTGIMELQPGQINWGKWNSQPLPGAVRMWIWHSFGLGDKFTCTYRFRQPLYGSEMYHNGIIETDGITVSRGGKEYVQAINEIKSLRVRYNPKVKIPAQVASRTTAFLWKQDNLLDLENVQHTEYWDSWQHYYNYYNALKTMGAPVVFISEDDEFDPQKYPFIVAPAYQMIDSALIKRWERYAQAGGNLILTCRTGQKDNDGHLWETLLQQPIWDLIGAKIEYVDQLPDNIEAKVKFEDTAYDWYVWGEVITPANDTQSLATYSDQFYSGKSASVSRKFAKGSVTYIGVQTLNGELEKQILRKIYTQQNARILDLPDYVFTEWRDGFWVTVNYSSLPVEAPIPTGATILIGEKNVKPAGVVVWMENN